MARRSPWKLLEPCFKPKFTKGGTGLSKTIVHNPVNKALCVRVTVESVLGQRTCFDMQIPRVLAG